MLLILPATLGAQTRPPIVAIYRRGGDLITAAADGEEHTLAPAQRDGSL